MSKVILITGCSSGFGLLTATRLAVGGHRVYATMRDLARQEPLIQETRRRGGGDNLTVLKLDVTDADGARAAVEGVVAKEGALDVLVNNAGFGMGGFFEDLSPADWQAQFAVNFFGVHNMIRAVLPVMRPRREGLIVNISSMAGFSGTPAFGAYVSSKFALEGFSECLYMELRRWGIDVALVEPGAYPTRIFGENARKAARFDDKNSPYFPLSQRLRGLVDEHMAANRRDPEEVAVVVESLVNSLRPPFRNIVGFRSRLRYCLVRHMPFRLYAWLVNRFLETDA